MNIGTELYIDTEMYQIIEKEEIILEIEEQVKLIFIAPNTDIMPYNESYEVLIKNIFTALKLEQMQYKILTLQKGIGLSSLFKYEQIQYFIVFGEAEKQIDFQFEYMRNRPIKFQNKQILFTDTLEILSNPANKTQKNEFWSGLQRMFITKK